LHHALSSKKRKTRTIHLAGKIMGILFQIGDGCMVVDFMPRKETVIVIVVCGIQMVTCTYYKYLKRRHIIHQHGNAFPHVVHLTSGKLKSLAGKCCPILHKVWSWSHQTTA
jgi:hypothetical protein